MNKLKQMRLKPDLLARQQNAAAIATF